MKDAFIAGGFGMYPTLVAGLALLATCFQYARRPEARYVPLMLTLGLFTVLAGMLGFSAGALTVLHYASLDAEAPGATIVMAGFSESLYNVVLALLLTVLSALLASVGAWRLSRQALPARPASP